MQFRPTLIIGLGGSGTFVVRRLKKRLRRLTQGEVPPSIQLLAFDTDEQNQNETLDQLSTGEFHRLSNFNGALYVTPSALATNPAIAAFWAYKDLFPDFIQDGAKQRPPIGRLALYVRFEDLRRQISDAVARMFSTFGGYQPPPNIGAVDVYVIGSSCGGTGAGMFFDVALLSKYLISKQTRDAIIQGHVFLPSCFAKEQVGLQSIQTNSCAFLRTMELLQSTQTPAIQYPSLRTEQMAAPLFRRVHLISAVDITGVRASDIQDTYENVALQLDLEITSASARAMRSAVDNSPPDFNSRPEGKLAIYSSYGAAILTGSSTVGRLAILPVFATRVVQYLLSSPTAERVSTATNRSLAQVVDILESEDAAFGLVENFQVEATRLANAERPTDAARNLVRRVDTVSSTLSLSSLAELSDLEIEMKNEIKRLIEAGAGGVPTSIEYLEYNLQRVESVLRLIGQIEASPKESADSIVSRMESWWQRDESRRRILETEGYPFFKSQTLLRVRDAVGRKARPVLVGLANNIQVWLQSLKKFGSASQAFIEDAERYSKEGIDRQRLIAGPKSGIKEDTADVKKRFEASAGELVPRFFLDPTGRRALADLSEAIIGSHTTDVWTGNFRRAADEYLQSALAESVTIGSGWPEQAARAIIECQPMVQFVADHLNLGQKAEKFVYARAHSAAEVRKRVLEIEPRLNVTIDNTAEPGSLEVTSMVLNFALHQIQEASLIEDGYRNFASSQAESVANRYAWRSPVSLWSRLRQLSLLPLSPRDQALARILALNPFSGDNATASASSSGYKVNGEQLDIDPDATQYQKYLTLNKKLLASGEAERLLQAWKDTDFNVARQHLTGLQGKAQERLQMAQSRAEEDGGNSFVAMLSEELEAVKHEIGRLPV